MEHFSLLKEPLAAQSAGSWALMVFLALGLAASAGLRMFLPLAMLSLAAKFQWFDISLTGHYAWLGSNFALSVLVLAVGVELVVDKIPAFDHLLDVFGTVARPLAGALASGASFQMTDPTMGIVLGMIVGAPTAFSFHTAKAGTRAASTTLTMGCLNPVLSFLEDIKAFTLIVLAFVAPVLVPVVLLAMVWIFSRLYCAIRRKAPEKLERVKGLARCFEQKYVSGTSR